MKFLPLDVCLAGSACWNPDCDKGVPGQLRQDEESKERAKSGLLRCARCKLAVFCGAQCQKAYWPAHKTSCKALAKREEITPVLVGPAGPWAWRVYAVKLKLEETLGRPLNKLEKCALDYEAHCSVPGCDATRGRDNACKLTACRDCGWGHACGLHTADELANARAIHAAQCQHFQMSNVLHFFRRRHMMDDPKHDDFHFIPDGRLQVPKFLPQSWAEYWKWRVPAQLVYQLAHVPEFFPAATHPLSQALTTLLGLQHFGLHQTAGGEGPSSLTVHVVGAGEFEWPPSPVWELLAHHIPSVRRLTVEFVGQAINSEEMPAIEMECCPECSGVGCKRLYGAMPTTYHAFRASSRYTKPDLVVAFNSGVHEAEVEQWRPTLEGLIQEGIPCLFTSYNELEATKDQAALEELGGHVTLATQPNPFRSEIPRIEVTDAKLKHPFYYSNNYYLCMRGTAPIQS